MKRFLFQGDSITDAGRADDSDLGTGYPLLVAADLMKNRKGEFSFFNRGESGDRITDIYARIKEDIINLAPDYMSILVGVNDVSHELTIKCGVDADKYEKIYTMLIEEVRAALPDIKIIILEPFVLKGTATQELWEQFYAEVKKRSAAAKCVAEKFSLEFVELQNKFDDACADGDTRYWSVDGVHPTAAGHQIIKEELLKAINKL
ncbi:MAG: SGNH/GDSL hydrolase family protein [Clostridia bacterium]|nr:SGNH/GDSL hydrolase family protein [Clostridia bacterium]